MDPFARLPLSLVIRVLQNLSLQQRLSQAALVCRVWATAAAAATVHVQHTLKPTSFAACEAWLQQHANHLISVQLSSTQSLQAMRMLRLPLRRFKVLERLSLKVFKLHLPCDGDSTDSGSIVAGNSSKATEECSAATQELLPSLQHLELWMIKLSSIDSLLQLTQAPQLTSLKVDRIVIAQPSYQSDSLCGARGVKADNSAAAAQQVAEAMPRMLQQLPRLAALIFPGFPFSDAAAQQLGAMHELKQVSLQHVRHVPAFDLALLPSSITQLNLHGNIDYVDNSPSLSPQMQHFSGLLVLKLSSCAVQPAVLAGVPQLQQLHVYQCTLLPRPVFPESDTEGTATLLDVLPKLSSLQHLELLLPYLDTPGLEVPVQHFSALTASSHLTALIIAPLPRGAAQHMFSAARPAQLLQRLEIGLQTLDDDDQFEVPAEDEWCINSTDVASICKGCPGLQQLDIMNTVKPGSDLSVLLQLPKSCTYLSVGGRGFTDTAAPVLAKLTQLKQLCWHYSPHFTDAGLEQLTALTGLTKLYCDTCGLGTEVSTDAEPGFVNLTKQMTASVSEQLDALCECSPVCVQVRRNRRQQAEIQQLQQEVSSVRLQLADRDAQISQLQRQLIAAQCRQQPSH